MSSKIQQDFDRLADLSGEKWGHNNHYHPFLLRHLLTKEHSQDYPNIDYQVADAMTYPFPAGQFGCVASIATLHHIPFEAILARIKPALAPGGVLLVLDLYKAESLADYATSAAAFPVNFALKLLKNGYIRELPEARAAWAEHGRTDVYLKLSEVRGACARLLPHARVTRHLLFRYSLVWNEKI